MLPIGCHTRLKTMSADDRISIYDQTFWFCTIYSTAYASALL